jgi:hypothetical protein
VTLSIHLLVLVGSFILQAFYLNKDSYFYENERQHRSYNPARFGDLFYRNKRAVSRSRNLQLHGRKKKFIEFVVIFIG